MLKVFMQKFEKQSADAYATAGSAASQAISSIRTVSAFGGQERELKRYTTQLDVARKTGAKKGAIIGLSTGALWLTLMSSYGVGLYFGAWRIRQEREDDSNCASATPGDDCFTGGNVIQVWMPRLAHQRHLMRAMLWVR